MKTGFFLIASLVAMPLAMATTLGSERAVLCPVDGERLHIRPVTAHFIPALNAEVTRGSVLPVHVCSCGFVGFDEDFLGGLVWTAAQRKLISAWLTQQPPLGQEPYATYARAARLATLLGRSPRVIGHRWLQAGVLARGAAEMRTAFRRAARDAFARAAPADPTAAYVAGELSRQLGDRALAHLYFSVLVSHASAPPQLVAWARDRLGAPSSPPALSGRPALRSP